jgi:hypothetical protein
MLATRSASRRRRPGFRWLPTRSSGGLLPPPVCHRGGPSRRRAVVLSPASRRPQMMYTLPPLSSRRERGTGWRSGFGPPARTHRLSVRGSNISNLSRIGRRTRTVSEAADRPDQPRQVPIGRPRTRRFAGSERSATGMPDTCRRGCDPPIAGDALSIPGRSGGADACGSATGRPVRPPAWASARVTPLGGRTEVRPMLPRHPILIPPGRMLRVVGTRSRSWWMGSDPRGPRRQPVHRPGSAVSGQQVVHPNTSS